MKKDIEKKIVDNIYSINGKILNEEKFGTNFFF